MPTDLLASDPPSPKEIIASLVEHIDAIARHILADEHRDAFEGMHVIATMIDTVRDCAKEKISPADTEHELSVLRQSILEAADPPPLPPPPIDDRFDRG